MAKLLGAAALLLTLAVGVAGGPPALRGAAPPGSCSLPAQEKCIETPLEYSSVWASRGVRCVSARLVGRWNPHSHSITAANRDWAFVVGHTNLEKFLRLNCMYADSNRVALGASVITGYYSLLEKDALNPRNDLLIWQLPENAGAELLPVVPTVEEWSRIFGSRGYYISLSAQLDLTLAYSMVGGAQGGNAVGVYSALAGCNYDKLMDPRGSVFECGGRWHAVRENATRAKRATEGSGNCVDFYFRNFVAPSGIDAVELRVAVLGVCLDASFLNTFNGFGFSGPYPNPLVCKSAASQTVRERHAGREIIVPNQPITRFAEDHGGYGGFLGREELGVKYVNITVKFDQSAPRPYLTTGWC